MQVFEAAAPEDYLGADEVIAVSDPAALGCGCYLMVKFRKSRRRMNRLLDVVRVPIPGDLPDF